jgi:serine O-acetyltransferase
MKLLKNINEDLHAAKKFSLSKKTKIFFSNRGFHALLFYRISNFFFKLKVPLLPLLLTRTIQILYAIDIDYRAELSGGIVIVHGVGLVVGQGVKIYSDVILFHGVTIGRRGIGPIISDNDGFPVVEEHCIISTGAVLLGNITIGTNSVIGANCVVAQSIPANSICKIPGSSFIIFNKL